MSHLDTAIDELRDLVAFDTTSRNTNLPLIDHVEAKLLALGAVCERIPSTDGKKANLHARFGPAVPGGVILSGHTDVCRLMVSPGRPTPGR